MSTVLTDPRTQVPQALAEKVLLGGDLSVLNATERLTYYNAVCSSLGLNPLTRPFEYLALNGKLTLYVRKDCTDQLRDLHGISVQIVGREIVDGCYVVTAQGKNMTERTDESIGAVPLPTSGIDKANAMMKAETKAKRRVTLSICGLGMLDETEIDQVAGAHPVPPPATVLEPSVNEVLRDMGEQDGLEQVGTAAASPVSQDAAHPYLDRIALSQSVRECSAVINQALADKELSVFQVTTIQDVGKARIIELRKK